MENKRIKSPSKKSRTNKSILKSYITDLMIKYKDKPDSIIVLHEIFLWLNESWIDKEIK